MHREAHRSLLEFPYTSLYIIYYYIYKYRESRGTPLLILTPAITGAPRAPPPGAPRPPVLFRPTPDSSGCPPPLGPPRGGPGRSPGYPGRPRRVPEPPRKALHAPSGEGAPAYLDRDPSPKEIMISWGSGRGASRPGHPPRTTPGGPPPPLLPPRGGCPGSLAPRPEPQRNHDFLGLGPRSK